MKKRILSAILLFSLVFTNFTVYATELEEVNSNKVFSSTVNAEAESSFSIQIPKIIELTDSDSNGSYDANYTITAIGDIAGDEVLSVVPDSSVTFTTDGKDSITGTVTQNKTTWYYDEFDTVTNGSITISNFSAGNWKGELNFDISLDTITLVPGLYNRDGELNVSYNEVLEINYDISTNLENEDSLDNNLSLLTAFVSTPDLYSRFMAMMEECEYLSNSEGDALYDEFMSYNFYSIILPDGIESIGSYQMFQVMYDVREISFPKTLKRIESYAFYVRNEHWDFEDFTLHSLVLPDSLEVIASKAFYCNMGLESINIPNSIKEIGEAAFFGCDSLKSVEYKGIIYDITNDLEEQELLQKLKDNGVSVGTELFTFEE